MATPPEVVSEITYTKPFEKMNFQNVNQLIELFQKENKVESFNNLSYNQQVQLLDEMGFNDYDDQILFIQRLKRVITPIKPSEINPRKKEVLTQPKENNSTQLNSNSSNTYNSYDYSNDSIYESLPFK